MKESRGEKVLLFLTLCELLDVLKAWQIPLEDPGNRHSWKPWSKKALTMCWTSSMCVVPLKSVEQHVLECSARSGPEAQKGYIALKMCPIRRFPLLFSYKEINCAGRGGVSTILTVPKVHSPMVCKHCLGPYGTYVLLYLVCFKPQFILRLECWKVGRQEFGVVLALFPL